MTPSQPDMVPTFTRLWRASSPTSDWVQRGDWGDPVAAAMVLAVLSGDGIRSAAAGLGKARATQGIGVVEGLEDLSALFHLVGRGDTPYEITLAFSGAWADATTASLITGAVTDPLTGLMTRGYLVARVREMYADALSRGIRACDERCLIVVERLSTSASGWQQVIRDSRVGRIVASILCDGQVNSVLPSGTILSVVPTGDSLAEYLARLTRALSPTENVRVEQLPATVRLAERMLLAL